MRNEQNELQTRQKHKFYTERPDRLKVDIAKILRRLAIISWFPALPLAAFLHRSPDHIDAPVFYFAIVFGHSRKFPEGQIFDFQYGYMRMTVDNDWLTCEYVGVAKRHSNALPQTGVLESSNVGLKKHVVSSF